MMQKSLVTKLSDPRKDVEVCGTGSARSDCVVCHQCPCHHSVHDHDGRNNLDDDGTVIDDSLSSDVALVPQPRITGQWHRVTS